MSVSQVSWDLGARVLREALKDVESFNLHLCHFSIKTRKLPTAGQQ